MNITIESWDWWKADGTVEAVRDGEHFFTTADRDHYRDEMGTVDMVIVGESFQLDLNASGPMQLVPMTPALADALEDALTDFVRDAT